ALSHHPVAADLAVYRDAVRVGYCGDARRPVEPFGRTASVCAGIARRLVRRDRGRAARSDRAFDPAAASGLAGSGPGATWLGAGRAVAAAAEYRGRLAADRRHDCRGDPVVRHRLRDLPAARGSRLATKPTGNKREGGQPAALAVFVTVG